MLIKINAPSGRRGEIIELVTLFRGRVVDVSPTELMVELSGPEKKIEAFVALVRPFGIKELCRTGRVALARGVR